MNDNLPVKIVKTPLNTVLIRAYCKKCGSELIRNGWSLLSSPQYQYRCEKCGIDFCSREEFPRVEYNPLEMKERGNSEWISVKDGLPENEEFVLVVCGISNQICLAFYEDGTVQEDFSHIAFDEDCDDWIDYDEKYDKSYIKRGWYEGNWYSEFFVPIPTEDVKYWMRLPSKPNCSVEMGKSEEPHENDTE